MSSAAVNQQISICANSDRSRIVEKPVGAVAVEIDKGAFPGIADRHGRIGRHLQRIDVLPGGYADIRGRRGDGRAARLGSPLSGALPLTPVRSCVPVAGATVPIVGHHCSFARNMRIIPVISRPGEFDLANCGGIDVLLRSEEDHQQPPRSGVGCKMETSWMQRTDPTFRPRSTA